MMLSLGVIGGQQVGWLYGCYEWWYCIHGHCAPVFSFGLIELPDC